jgi:hypothetical protein
VAHRAAIYTVRVRPKRKKADDDYLLLGDIDANGTRLATVLTGIGNGLMEHTDEGTTKIRCYRCEAAGDEVFMMLTHGQSGVVADIIDRNNQPRFHQELEHTHEVRCGALFVLPPAQKMGWLSVHINAGRGVKGLLEKGLMKAFRDVREELMLEINPAVSGSTLRQAAQANQIEKVKLVKLLRPDDPARAITDNWVRGNTIGQLELDVTGFVPSRDDAGHGRGRLRDKLRPALVLDYFRGQKAAAFDAMVEVLGVRFDQVKFEVVLPNGTHRTYNIEHPDTGHAITEDLDGLRMAEGVPTEASLKRALRAAIEHAQA